MDRRGFLRGLGLLAGYAAIPKSILPVTDFIESKSTPSIKQGKFINHMTIQRRTVSITGSASSRVLWHNNDGVMGFSPETLTNEDKIKHFKTIC